ncbi:MAG: bifunctional ADP-dependent NAD(P)H-hydrate dehydratase/NAD(P)H-hydrate epimerase [Anaerolineae bacterium]
MPKIVTVEEMRAIEAATDAAGVSYDAMMDHAGRAVADLIIERLAGLEGASVVVLVGPGNNGGDGLVAGRLIAEETDAQVYFYLLSERDADDANFAKVKKAKLPLTLAADDKKGSTLREWLADADVVVDALLGTGARLPVKGALADVLSAVGETIAAQRAALGAAYRYGTPAEPRAAWDGEPPWVVAVDCPSGLDCDTGEIDPVALKADDTVTFAAVKLGQVRFPGAAMLGRLHVADIGTPPDLKALHAVALELADGPSVRRLLPARPADGHKNTFGKALVVAGSTNYVGAAALAAMSAYRVGVGWVTVAAPSPVVPMLAPRVTEATWLYLPHDMGVLAPQAATVLHKEMTPYSAMLLGPGWGQEKPTEDFLKALLRPAGPKVKRGMGFVLTEAPGEAPQDPTLPPLVIDADGLNLLAKLDDWPSLLPEGSILTPHPGEMSRLCGIDQEEVNADRIGLAQARAAAWKCVVVLKGAHTVVAAPDGRVAVMPFATSALATAGTGDVLAGAILGFRAQGLEPFAAAVAGAYVHGLAGVEAEEEMLTPASVTAGDVRDRLPLALAMVASAIR